MNKKGNINDLLADNAIYLILMAAFAGIVLAFIGLQMNGADIWSQYYVGEVTRIVNAAEPGDEISLAVGGAIAIANRNDIYDSGDIFSFDAEDRRICVQLADDAENCLFYFNDVIVVDVDLGPSEESGVLKFRIIEPREVINEN